MADKFRKAKSNFATTLVTGIGTGTGDTITLNSTTGLPTDTEITLTFNRVTSSGTVNSTTVMERITGTISGATLTSYTRGVDGTTEQAHAGGTVVEYVPNAADMNDQVDGILVGHNQDGTHKASYATLAGTEVLSNKTLTLPQINDTTADHQYVTAVSELTADRTVTLPLLTGNDEFVFKDHTQTLTNKTLTSPVITTPTVTQILGVGAGKVYPEITCAKVTCSANTSTADNTTPVDVTGATVTFTPEVACTAIVTVFGDISGNAVGNIAVLTLLVDGSAQASQALFTSSAIGDRATIGQTYVINLTAEQHILKLQLNRAGGTGLSTAYAPHTGFSYFLLSQ